MAGYIGSKASVVSSGAERKTTITATSGQTSLTGLSYTPNQVHVFQNGVRLVDGTDYTATNGSSITLTVGAFADDQIVVISYATFETSDTVSASAGGTFSSNVSFNSGITIEGAIAEEVYTLSGTALDPDNGTIQIKTLSANTTLTDSVSAGESITLMIDDGSSYTITWPTITWVNNGGSAPTLATSGYTVIVVWKVSTTLYGALVGDGT